MTQTLALLALAMLVQGSALFFLLPGLPRLLLVAYLLLCAGLWLHARRQRLRAEAPLRDLAARLLTMAPGSGSTPPRTSDSELEWAVHRLQQRLSQTLLQTRELRDRSEDAGVYRTAFLRAVSHELRTPLNAILGFTDVLLSGLEGPLSDDRRENLSVIRESGQRLLSLFNDAIELSAMASGQLSLRRENIDLAGLLEEAVAKVEKARGLRPVHVTVHSESAGIAVSGQRDRLLRVLEILGQTAVLRTEAGQVAFHVDVPGAAAVRIRVSDHGEPYPKAHMARLFAPELAQSPDERREALRLAIAAQLVELHGGELSAGAGDERFTLWLPRASPETSTPSDGVT